MSDELSTAWFQFHAFITMGGFKMENLSPAYQEQFRVAQRRVVDAFIAAGRAVPVVEQACLQDSALQRQ